MRCWSVELRCLLSQLGSIQGVTVKAAVRFVPLIAAVMVTEVEEVTLFVVMPNLTVVMPAGTVAFFGTVATEERLLESATVVPPVGAGPSSVRVPVDRLPPCTVLGLRVRDDIVGALTVKVARCITLL